MLDEAHVAEDAHFGFIRRLLASESYLLRDHLQRLDSDARHRRFGHDVSDAFIASYAAHASDFGNVTFGYFVDGEIRGVAELRPGALMRQESAEVAFSVERPFANRGIATQLMGRVVRTARNRGFSHLTLISCLTMPRCRQSLVTMVRTSRSKTDQSSPTSFPIAPTTDRWSPK